MCAEKMPKVEPGRIPIENVLSTGLPTGAAPIYLRQLARAFDLSMAKQGHDVWMTRDQLGKMMGVAPRTLERYIKDRLIHPLRLGPMHPVFWRWEVAMRMAASVDEESFLGQRAAEMLAEMREEEV